MIHRRFFYAEVKLMTKIKDEAEAEAEDEAERFTRELREYVPSPLQFPTETEINRIKEILKTRGQKIISGGIIGNAWLNILYISTWSMTSVDHELKELEKFYQIGDCKW